MKALAKDGSSVTFLGRVLSKMRSFEVKLVKEIIEDSELF